MTLSHPRHFTDREEAIAAYDALWCAGTGPRILNFEGMSGNGKTTLLWYLAHHHDNPKDVICAELDLAKETLRSGDYALLDDLAQQWERYLPPDALDRYYDLCDELG